MASFQANIGLKSPRKRESKNYRSVSFRVVPTQQVNESSKNRAKKFKKCCYGFISSQNRLEKVEKERE